MRERRGREEEKRKEELLINICDYYGERETVFCTVVSSNLMSSSLSPSLFTRLQVVLVQTVLHW